MELGKRALELSLLTVFTAWALWLLCLPLSFPRMWNLVFRPPGDSRWARSSQRWSPETPSPLSVLYPVPPHGIGHSRAPLCPPLSQGTPEGATSSFISLTEWHTHSMIAKNWCCPDPQGDGGGDATQMHTWSSATLGPGGHLSLVSCSVFGNRKPKRKSQHPLTLSCAPPHIPKQLCNPP